MEDMRSKRLSMSMVMAAKLGDSGWEMRGDGVQRSMVQGARKLHERDGATVQVIVCVGNQYDACLWFGISIYESKDQCVTQSVLLSCLCWYAFGDC
jgi:hypothetical protein